MNPVASGSTTPTTTQTPNTGSSLGSALSALQKAGGASPSKTGAGPIQNTSVGSLSTATATPASPTLGSGAGIKAGLPSMMGYAGQTLGQVANPNMGGVGSGTGMNYEVGSPGLGSAASVLNQ